MEVARAAHRRVCRAREQGAEGSTLRSDPYFHLFNALIQPGFAGTRRTETRTSTDCPVLPGRGQRSYTIFEGTSEVQRLVIARAISGVHIR